MMGMVLVVCGGRDYNDVPELFRALDVFHEKKPIALIVEGASDDVTGPYKGADYWARQWAIARGIPRTSVHADWRLHGKAAGPIRNRQMLERYEPKCVFAFPGGRGTDSMKQIARKAKVKVVKAFSWMAD